MYNDVTARSANIQAGMGVVLWFSSFLVCVLEFKILNVYI
jgi:hypothetical protein